MQRYILNSNFKIFLLHFLQSYDFNYPPLKGKPIENFILFTNKPQKKKIRILQMS